MSNIEYLSPRRQLLSSFDHAYAVAVQRRMATNKRQFIVRTSDPMQPYRVTTEPPANDEDLATLVA